KHTTPPRWLWICLITVSQCYGGHGGGETPGPIPNPEAKPSSADGTAPDRMWESRTPPDFVSGAPVRTQSEQGLLCVRGRIRLPQIVGPVTCGPGTLGSWRCVFTRIQRSTGG